ncbi:MAG: Crp/Fnr family transcriptional regulator [Cytophagaceae bacterium]|nr:MAG: Crp/Fnr family transcriptional regulator [Cytophagaceae bacterium]
MPDISLTIRSVYAFEPDLLAELDVISHFRTVDAGAVLMEPGQPMQYVPIVLTGSIRITRPDEDSGELLLYYLNAADSCALSMSSLLSGEASPILAVVEEKAQILMIPVERAESWLGQYASWRKFVFQTYQKRFDNLLQTLDGVAFRQLDERLLAYLNQKASLVGGRHVYITHENIARDLHTSREVVSRLLKQLERRGWVSIARNKISLHSQHL